MAQRKATPHSRLTHSPCAPGSRACCGVRRQSIHGLASNWPTSCGPSFGHSLRSLATIEGPHIACLVHAKAKIKGPSATAPCVALPPASMQSSSALPGTFSRKREKETPEQSQNVRASDFSLLRTMRINRGPYAAAKWWRNCPQGGSHGCEPVGCPSRAGRAANPGTASRSRRAGDCMDAVGRATQEQLPDARRPLYRGGLSLGAFSLATQREDTRSPEASETPAGMPRDKGACFGSTKSPSACLGEAEPVLSLSKGSDGEVNEASKKSTTPINPENYSTESFSSE